ncbi:actin-binding protein wsp1-like [Miscanthus floridulus]|uniref:actin-binding protein wsp1-like n=1 Tax=Miscanthus floridulus TaxID=154761 RepID=UPI00345B07E7
MRDTIALFEQELARHNGQTTMPGFSLLIGPPPRFWPTCRSRPSAPASRPQQRASRASPPRLGPAQPRAVPLLAARPRADRGRDIPPRGDHVPASPAARQPRPDTAPTRLPSPAGARALAHSRSRFLSSPPEPRARALPLAAPAAPPASNSRTTTPFLDSSRPQLRLALLQAALELAPPSEHRSSPPASRHRRPWRRRARPPWKPSSFSSPASPSYPTVLAFSSHIPCAHRFALPWPEMAAGRWPSRAAAPARTPARHSASAC